MWGICTFLHRCHGISFVNIVNSATSDKVVDMFVKQFYPSVNGGGLFNTLLS